MKSQTRAWIVFILLFVFWGTLPASPFSYFTGMIRDWALFLFRRPFLPLAWQVVLIYLLVFLFFVALLLLGRSGSRTYIAGFCALAGMVHHLIICLKTQQIYDVSPAIATGLALALLFLLIKPQAPALWLSDAFILSLPIWLLLDGFLSPLFQLLDLAPNTLAPFIPVPAHSILTGLDGVGGIPQSVWTILPLALALVPMIWLTPGRKKG